MEYVLGIDIGTSACKTVIVDTHGDIVGSASEEYSAKTDARGTAFMDPMDWYKAAVNTLRSACANSGIAGSDIAAVGVSGQMQGATFIGDDGNAVRDSMIWHDQSPLKESKWLSDNYVDLYRKHCHITPSPAQTASKIRWLMINEPDNWKATRKFLFAPSYITFKLTGQTVADPNNLGLSGLNDVASGNWCYELIDALGIAREKVPSLHGCLDIIGKVTGRAARETGLAEGTPVIAGCGDGGAENYSVNIAGKQEMKIRLGSAMAASIVIDAKKLAGTTRGTPYISAGFLDVANYTNACARSVKWARGMFFRDLPQTDGTYGLMDLEAADVPLGANGVMYHPYLGGEHAPYYNPRLRAKITGINSGHVRGDFLKAVYEGISFSIRDMMGVMEEMQRLPSVVFVGGGTKSAVWMSALVDVLGKNGVIPQYGDAAYGVALMAADAAGLFDGAQAAERSKKNGTPLSFDPENHEKYSLLFKRYQKLALAEWNVDNELAQAR